jgi:hypothetical protein
MAAVASSALFVGFLIALLTIWRGNLRAPMAIHFISMQQECRLPPHVERGRKW